MADKRPYELTELTSPTGDEMAMVDLSTYAEAQVIKLSNILEYLKASLVPFTGATQDVDLGTMNFETTGYVSGKKSGCFAYLTADAITTITTASTYYAIGGTFNNDVAENFTAVATPALRYDGTVAQYFHIQYHASFKCNAGATVLIGIKKNGVLEAGSVMGQYTKNAGELYHLSGTCVVSLEEDDEIQLVCTSSTNGDQVNMYYFTTTISEFYD